VILQSGCADSPLVVYIAEFGHYLLKIQLNKKKYSPGSP
jgi:hypothetical protein